MTKLTGVFHDYAKAPQKMYKICAKHCVMLFTSVIRTVS